MVNIPASKTSGGTSHTCTEIITWNQNNMK